MAQPRLRRLDHYEDRLHRQGFRLVAGVDEAGRGALAGPLVAAAVILPDDFDIDGLADSKELTPAQRERCFERIHAQAVAICVRRTLPGRIDRRGLHRSNLSLLGKALRDLDIQPDFVIADGFAPRTIRVPYMSMKKADAISACVAAASIIAKVTRDRAMERYHRRFPQYGFDRHRGYGTASHRAAIARFGPSPIHRMSFKGMTLYGQQPDLYRELYGGDSMRAASRRIDSLED